MSKKRRSIILLAIVLLASLAVGLAVLLSDSGSQHQASTASGALGEGRGVNGDSGGEGAGASDSVVLVKSAAGTTYRIVRPKDVPTPPASPPSSPDAPVTDAWQQYVDQTRAIVEDHEAGLVEAIAAVDAALRSHDSATLETMLAPDEGAAGFGGELADRCPSITSSSQLPTVNVFSSGQATLYFAYTLVEWQDAGIPSAHTIPIVFRFVNGQWVITVLGETGSELTFVQSVAL